MLNVAVDEPVCDADPVDPCKLPSGSLPVVHVTLYVPLPGPTRNGCKCGVAAPSFRTIKPVRAEPAKNCANAGTELGPGTATAVSDCSGEITTLYIGVTDDNDELVCATGAVPLTPRYAVDVGDHVRAGNVVEPALIGMVYAYCCVPVASVQ